MVVLGFYVGVNCGHSANCLVKLLSGLWMLGCLEFSGSMVEKQDKKVAFLVVQFVLAKLWPQLDPVKLALLYCGLSDFYYQAGP